MMFVKIVPTSAVWFLIECFILSTTYLPEIDGLNTNQKIGSDLVKRSKGAEIRSSMDSTQDPCGNFHTYACGNWQRINAAGSYLETLQKSEEITEAMDKRIEKFLSQPKTGNVIDDKIRDFYRSCQNVEAETFAAAIKGIIEEYGQFSFLKSQGNEGTNRNFNWWSTLAKMYNKYGKTAIVSVNVANHLRDNTRTMVFIEPSAYGFEEMSKLLLQIFVTLVKGGSVDEAKHMMDNLKNFQNALEQADSDGSAGESPADSYTLYNINALHVKYKHLFDTKVFLRTLLNVTELPAQVYVRDTKYLDNLIKVFNTTQPDIVEDYILWSLVEEYIAGTYACTYSAERYFGKYLQQTIYKEYRSAVYENEIYALWQELKAAFQDGMQTGRYAWMTNTTMQLANYKLGSLELKLNTYDDENFEAFFRGLKIDPSNYVVNVHNILKRTEAMRPDKLQRTPPNFDEMYEETIAVTYDRRRNLVKVPIANLQPFLLWNPIYPKAIKYAVWGSLLAREMLQAFDGSGCYYDVNGNANAWCDRKSVDNLKLRQDCFRAQYNKYSVRDSDDQAQNIADNGAVRIAYLAYQRWLEGQLQRQQHREVYASEKFANLPYSHRELFFISYAQYWCELVNWDNENNFDEYESTPLKLRIIGSLSNFPTFSEVFKCDAGGLMSNAKKCELF